MMIHIGEKLVEYNPEFRLFLATRDPLLSFPPYMTRIISEVDFQITRAGLSGQLLGIALAAEKPELEEQRTSILAEEERLRIELSNLEKVN